MSDFSRTLIERSGYESEDFADLYNRYRLAPPRELLDILTLVADAGRIIGLAESLGGPRGIFGDAAPEVGETFERLRDTTKRVVGNRMRPIVVCYRIRVGVK